MFNTPQRWRLSSWLLAIGIGGCIFFIAANLGKAYDATANQRLKAENQQLKTENQRLKGENQRLKEIQTQIHQLTQEK